MNAQYELGIMYEKGEGVTKDPKVALYLYEKAAEQGHVNSQHETGRIYKH